MGSCYSRKTAGAGLSPGDKAHKQKHIRSKSNNKQGIKELPPEKVPLTDGIEDIQEKQLVNALTSNTSHSSGTELVLEYLNLKLADHCVAPSDSGIESIQTLSEDAQDTVLATSERDELVKRLEHLDFDRCQKCGCLKLNSGSLLAVLKDGGGIHDSSLAKKFLSKPHDSNYYIEGKGNSSHTDSTKCSGGRALATTNKEVSGLNSSSNAEDNSHVDTISETQSDLEKSNSISKDAYNVSSSSESSSVIWSKHMNKDIIYNLLVKGQCNAKASLPHCDGVDTCQNGSPSKKLSKQQNLLTSILNHTDSICKCDLHSNEYDLARDHEMNGAVLKQGQFGEFSSNAPNHTSEQLKRKDESLKYSNSGVETSSHQTEVSIFHSCTGQDKSSTSISSSEQKHFHSSKIASVSTRGETKSEAFIKPASSSTTEPILASEQTCANHHDSSIMDSSSGAYIQKTTLELLSLSGHRGNVFFFLARL